MIRRKIPRVYSTYLPDWHQCMLTMRVKYLSRYWGTPFYLWAEAAADVWALWYTNESMKECLNKCLNVNSLFTNLTNPPLLLRHTVLLSSILCCSAVGSSAWWNLQIHQECSWIKWANSYGGQDSEWVGRVRSKEGFSSLASRMQPCKYAQCSKNL